MGITEIDEIRQAAVDGHYETILYDLGVDRTTGGYEIIETIETLLKEIDRLTAIAFTASASAAQSAAHQNDIVAQLHNQNIARQARRGGF